MIIVEMKSDFRKKAYGEKELLKIWNILENVDE